MFFTASWIIPTVEVTRNLPFAGLVVGGAQPIIQSDTINSKNNERDFNV